MRKAKLKLQPQIRVAFTIAFFIYSAVLYGMSSRPPAEEILDSLKKTLPEYPQPQYVYEKAAEYFLTCDSLLKALTYDDNVCSARLDVSAKALADINGKYPAITSFIRTNSKGMIIAQAENGKAVPKSVHNFRNVSSQRWFEIISLSKKEYYGYINSRSSGLCLFWNHPMVERGDFRGAIAAKIDLKKAFKTVAEQEDLTFEVRYEKNNLFSNLKPGVKTIDKELAVYGISGLVISYPEYTGREMTSVKSSVVSTEQENKKEEAKEEMKEEEKEKKEEAKEKEKEKEGVKEQENGKTGFPAGLTVTLIVLLIILIAGGLIYLQIRTKKKNREMMEAIDKGEI